MVNADTIIAGTAALVSAIAALVAIGNAKSAAKQANLAEEQADAAKIQAEEAKRSADAAWLQLDHSKQQYDAELVERQRHAFESVLKGSREYARFLDRCLKVGAFDKLQDDDRHGFVNSMPSEIPDYKVLWGTLPDAEFKFVLHQIREHSTSLMGNAMLLLASKSATSIEEVADLESIKEKVLDRRQKFHDATNRFGNLGAHHFETELRRLAGLDTRRHGAVVKMGRGLTDS